MWPFKKYPIMCVIFADREGGRELVIDYARKARKPNDPKNIFYYLKNQKTYTRPVSHYKLIPWKKGKKVLPLWGVSDNEFYCLDFRNLKKMLFHVQNEKGERLYYKTQRLQAKDDQERPLFYAVNDKGDKKDPEEITTEATQFPIYTGYEIVGKKVKKRLVNKKNKPLFWQVNSEGGVSNTETTTEPNEYPAYRIEIVPEIVTYKTQEPLMEEGIGKIVEPEAAELGLFTAEAQEEAFAKYDYRSWFDKYGHIFMFAVIALITGITVFLIYGEINKMMGNIGTISQDIRNLVDVVANLSRVAQGGQYIPG